MKFCWPASPSGCRARGPSLRVAATRLPAPGTEVVAIAGGSRAPELARRFGVALEPDATALLRRPDLDAVIVATPHHLHAAAAHAALAGGKHVLVEKPLATTVADCDRLIDSARRRGLTLSPVLECWLYPPAGAGCRWQGARTRLDGEPQ